MNSSAPLPSSVTAAHPLHVVISDKTELKGVTESISLHFRFLPKLGFVTVVNMWKLCFAFYAVELMILYSRCFFVIAGCACWSVSLHVLVCSTFLCDFLVHC